MMRDSSPVSRSFRFSAIILVTLAIAATGCGLDAIHTQRASDEWSNGKLIGAAILNNQVALETDEAGNAYLVWIGPEHALTFAQLNESAETVVQRTLDLRTKSAQKPQLAMDGDGRLHLIWLDRWEQNTQVLYARLSEDGDVIQDAKILTPSERKAIHATMVLEPEQETVEVFWSDSVPSRPGCYHTALDWSGEVLIAPEMLVADGLFPAAQVDRRGYIHLAWRAAAGDPPQFHYAVYDPQGRELGPDVVAGRPSIQMGMLGGPTAGARFDGPWLGLDSDSAYLAWVLQMRERDARDFTFYVAFALPELPNREIVDGFSYTLPDVSGQAVSVQPGDPAMTGHPHFLGGQPPRQVLACFSEISSPGNVETLQIAAIDLLPNQVHRQEIVNLSRGASLRPNVALDASGHLRLAWIDTAGFERYNVVYASTSPQAKDTLNRVTAYDVVNKVLNTVMAVITSLFFTPLALIWVLVPVVWLVLFTSVTHTVEVSDRLSSFALAIAMLLQLVVKLLLFGDLLSRFPFTHWMKSSFNPLVGRWLFPGFLAAASGALVWIYLRRSRMRSIFGVYFLFAAIDTFLTLVVYVAVPMGW